MVFKNALTSIQRPGRVFKSPDVFTTTTLFLKARTCLKSKEVFNNALTSIQRPGRVNKGLDVFSKARHVCEHLNVFMNA